MRDDGVAEEVMVPMSFVCFLHLFKSWQGKTEATCLIYAEKE